MERRLAAILAADMVGYSRLIEADEDGVLARQKSYRRGLIDPAIHARHGKIVKTTGDGMLAEFASAQDAVRCALEIQGDMQTREADQRDRERIQYRIGINVGDIVFDEDDVFGDGVNVAARLESIAEPGGVCIPDAVFRMLPDSVSGGFADLGSQKLKNIARPVKVWQWVPGAEARATEETPDAALNQRIGFCIAPDGVQLAYSSVGEGPPVFKAPNWLNHLEYEWRSPVWGPAWTEIARHHRLVRFDQRGNGLSDWEVEDVSADAMISDMETVVEAAGLETFSIFAISQGCAFSLRYAVEHPERVRAMVLLGGYVRGALNRGAEQRSIHEATNTLIMQGWGSSNPVYRHLFTEAMMADASPEQKASFDELQRVATSPENAARINQMNAELEMSDVARRVKVPVLVMHAEGDRRVPLEEGRRMAALIPGARFVALPGNNHGLIGGSPAFERFFEEFNAFLAEHGGD